MVFHYFARLDGRRDGANLQKYAEQLLAGRPEREARAALWNGRNNEQLEADFAKAWNQLGVVVRFR